MTVNKRGKLHCIGLCSPNSGYHHIFYSVTTNAKAGQCFGKKKELVWDHFEADYMIVQIFKNQGKIK